MDKNEAIRLIQRTPIRHDNLKPDVETRLRRVYYRLRQNATVVKLSKMDMPFPDVERNFRKDADPEREVMVWEIITDRMCEFLQNNPFASPHSIQETWWDVVFQVRLDHPIMIMVDQPTQAHDGQNRCSGTL